MTPRADKVDLPADCGAGVQRDRFDVLSLEVETVNE